MDIPMVFLIVEPPAGHHVLRQGLLQFLGHLLRNFSQLDEDWMMKIGLCWDVCQLLFDLFDLFATPLKLILKSIEIY